MTLKNYTWTWTGWTWKKVYNTAPDAADDTYSGDFNTKITGNVLDNDTDADGDKLCVISVTQPENGTVKMFSDGSFSYTPNDGFSGTDTFTYKISDGKGGYDTATVTVTVGADPSQPVDDDDDSDNDDTDTPDDGDCSKGGFNPEAFDAISLNYSDAVDGSIKVSASDSTAGDFVTYNNVATLDDGTSVSARLVLVSKSNDHLKVDLASSDDYEILLNGNNNSGMDGETATFRLEFFNTETGEPVALNPAIVFADLDKNKGTEGISINDENLANVGVSDGSNLDVNFDGGSSVTAKGTTDNIDPNLLESQFLALYQDTDSITFTMTSRAVNSGLNFGEAVPENFNMLTNADPIAVDDEFTGELNEVISGNVLDNDSDPDNDKICVISNTDPANGSVIVNTDGTFTYTPNDGFSGVDTFTYTVTDGNGGTDTATVTISVVVANSPPDAVDDAFTGGFNQPITDNVLDNDSDPDGDTLKVIGNSNPFNGTVTIAEDGTFTYTPNQGFSGNDGFTYTVSDGNGGTDTATVTLSVGANSAPIAVKDTGEGAFGEDIVGNVLDNDSDPDGDDLKVISNTNPLYGTVNVDQDGNFTYTPNEGFSGNDQFTYTVSDGFGGTSTAVVSLTVGEEPNEAPDAVADDFSGQAGEPIFGSVLDNDSDPDGDALTVISNTSPENGKLVIGADGEFIYVPEEGFFGEDSFTYTISDGKGGTDTATVNLTVNAAPDANDDVFLTQEGEPVSGNVLDNDTDADGGELTIIGNTDAANGTLLLNDDGSFTYTPNDGFTGPDSFTYTVTDGQGGTDTATVNLTVNAGPDANDDDVLTQKGTPITGNVLDNDTDADGDPLTIIGNTDPENGTLLLNDDGSFTYTPNDGFSGDDSFTYTVSDGNGGTDSATVNLTVNTPPEAVDDLADTEFDSAISGNVLDNDTDLDGDTLSVISNTEPSNGTVVVNADGQFIYSPNDGFSGEDSFSYTISDGKGATDAATVTVTVGEAPNNAPSAENDFFTAAFNTEITGNVLDNDTDPDGDTLTATLTTGPENGSIVFNADGSFTYTPNDGFFGEDSFTYTASDGNGGTDTATVNLFSEKECEPDNRPPIAVDDAFTAGGIGQTVEGNVLDNDSDPDGDPLSVLLNNQPQNGSVTLNPDGTFTYTPNEGFFGEDSFEYVVSDGRGGADLGKVHITVPCFAAGTLIVTAEGPKLVEEIRIGDKVLTRDDGFQEVRWAGQRVLDDGYLAQNPDFASVMIRAGALGNKLPRRDLRVSPGHRILLSGYQAELLFGEREVLVAACDLVGQPGIEHDARSVTYVHIMFDSHQIIDSEGAWSESFQPADVTLNGLDTQQRDELLALFPELATRKGQSGYATARRVLARHESSALLAM